MTTVAAKFLSVLTVPPVNHQLVLKLIVLTAQLVTLFKDQVMECIIDARNYMKLFIISFYSRGYSERHGQLGTQPPKQNKFGTFSL